MSYYNSCYPQRSCGNNDRCFREHAPAAGCVSGKTGDRSLGRMGERPSGRSPIARSAFMRSEEIERERAMSGWNPYEGEEEDARMMRDDRMMRDGWMEREDRMSRDNGMMREDRMPGDDGMMRDDRMEREDRMMQDNRMPRDDGMMRDDRMPQDGQMMRPYFQMPEYSQVLEEQRMMERDFRKLQFMYSETAKALLPFIEEECDKMEYEGSPMFDEFPDQTTIYRIQERIQNQAQDQFPEAIAQEAPDEMLSMQYQGNRRNRNWLGDLARVMLLQEMHHRRCRHRECRRKRW